MRARLPVSASERLPRVPQGLPELTSSSSEAGNTPGDKGETSFIGGDAAADGICEGMSLRGEVGDGVW